MDDKSWLTNLVTRRTTVMTPLLILNVVVLFFTALVYWNSNKFFVFIPYIVLLVYTVIRHELWAQKTPHLLAPEQIALRGLELYGTNDKGISARNVIKMETIENPRDLSINTDSGKKKLK